MTQQEQILKYIHVNWLSKSKTITKDGSELTMLPYGYLSQAVEDALDMQKKQIIDAVEKLHKDEMNEESYMLLDRHEREEYSEDTIGFNNGIDAVLTIIQNL